MSDNLCATCEERPALFQYRWGTDKPQVCCADCLPGLMDGADRYHRTFTAEPLPLIAAAPELLETIRHIESILVHRNNMLPDPKEMIYMCRTAIAKAEGRQ